MSANKAPNICPLPTARFHFSNKAKRHCCVLQHFLKTYCYFDKMLSKELDICANMLFENTFKSIGRILTGLQFCFFKSSLPFLCKRVTPAIFKQDGNENDLKELLMFLHKELANMSMFSLIILILTLILVGFIFISFEFVLFYVLKPFHATGLF